MKTKLLLLGFLICCFTVSFSQQQSQSSSLSLQECVKIALENNLRVKRSLYNVETYEVNLLQSKMAFLPTANAGGAYGQNYGRNLNPVTNSFVNRNSTTTNAQLTSSLTLFNGLRLQNSFRQSQRDKEASDQDFEKAKNDVIVNVITLYTNVIYNKELYENAKFQLNSSEEQLNRIKKQVEAGSVSKSNELNQEAQVATNEVSVINQENALNLSILQLKQAMQIPATQNFDVVKPEVGVEDIILDQTVDQIYQQAYAAMPEIKSAALKMESSEMALKASKGNLYPRLSLNASAQSNSSNLNKKFIPEGVGLSTTPIGQVGSVMGAGDNVYAYQQTGTSKDYAHTQQLKDNIYKVLSLQVSIPIFNGYQNRAAVQRAAINTELAKITVQETANTLRQTIETAYNDAISASKTYNASLKQVSAREEAYRMNKQRFESGALSFVEFHVSENDLFQSQNDLTRAKYNFIFRKKLLDFYQGKPIGY
jgi:outer membrane protein